MKLTLVALLSIVLAGCGGYGSSSMNPGQAPTLASLTPNNVGHGNAVMVTLTGTGFTTGAVVYFGMTPIAAASIGYGSSTQLTANISAAQTANAGPVNMYVHTAGGNSNTLPFTIN